MQTISHGSTYDSHQPVANARQVYRIATVLLFAVILLTLSGIVVTAQAEEAIQAKETIQAEETVKTVASTETTVLRIGISGSLPPFNYLDHTGEIQGFNADIARSVCIHMQRSCTFVVTPFPTIIPALEADKIDFAVSNLLYTEERAKKILFTNKYYRSTTSLIGPSQFSHTDPQQWLSQNKSRVAVTVGTTQERFLAAYAVNILRYQSLGDTLKAVQSREADFALTPTLFALSFLQNPENSHLDFIGTPIDETILSGDVHIGVRKTAPELQHALNQALATMVESGELRALIHRYFPFNVY